ncbi:MAG: alpha/beta hydrolase [Azospirillaceae bacterium]
MPGYRPSRRPFPPPRARLSRRAAIRRAAGSLAALAVAPVSLTACAPVALLDAVDPASGPVERAIAYGDHPRQRLDLHRPAEGGAPPTAVAVWFYGGSWRNGERGHYDFAARRLADAGAATIVPDYRLYPEVTYPAFLEDGAAAVAWAVDRLGAGRPGGAPLILAGHSAGAYIAAMLALDPRWLDAAGPGRGVVDGWIGLSGPYDFYPFETRITRAVFAGLEEPRESQPITHAGPGAPPCLLVTGESDGTVLPRNTRRLAEALRAAGAPVEVVTVPGGHATTLKALSRPFADARVIDPVTRFIAGRASV